MIIFAPEGKYDPAGMFTIEHIIALVICLILIGIAFWLSRKINEKQLYCITKYIAVFVTICEIIKIIYKFVVCNQNFWMFDTWVPLYYCSIFIFATLFICSKNKLLLQLGEAFIVGGTFAGGLSFLIFPTTSLSLVPIWHYLSIHSMIYHSLMVYLALLYIWHNKFILKWKQFGIYIVSVIIFLVPALIVNYIGDYNLMLLTRPYNIPIAFINEIYNFMPWLYPLLVSLVYIIGPYVVSIGVYFILKKIKKGFADSK